MPAQIEVCLISHQIQYLSFIYKKHAIKSKFYVFIFSLKCYIYNELTFETKNVVLSKWIK